MISVSLLLNLLAYACALIGFIPLAPYLGLFPALSVPVAMLFGFWADRRDRALKGRFPTIITILVAAWYLLQVRGHNLVGPAANLLAVLLAVRLASEKSTRHYLQIFILALFLLAASTLFSLDLLFFVYLCLLLVLFAVALVLLCVFAENPEQRLQIPSIRRLTGVALLLPLATLPLMVIFFFILPRTQMPLWNYLATAAIGETGISDAVQPGDKAAVENNNRVAFRAAMPQLPPEQLYWRVTVLNALQGSRWHRTTPLPAETSLPPGGATVRQTIYLEPGRIRYYPCLDQPVRIMGVRSTASPDLVFQARSSRGSRLEYRVDSAVDRPVRTSRSIDREFYTRLPHGLSRRLKQIGRTVAARGKSDTERLQLLEEFFSTQHLSYATTGLPTGPDAMEQFLFTARRGHCELFASTFAVLLRAAGIPARLVGGYYGGEYNDLGGYYAITESRAHVWVEAWLTGRGWVRVDPSRLSSGFAAMTAERRTGLRSRLALYLDAVNYFWNVTIINYDLERQLSALTRAGSGLRGIHVRLRPADLWPWLVVIAGAAGVVALLRRRPRSREDRLLAAFDRALQTAYGCRIPPNRGLQESVAHLRDPAVHRFVALYTSAIYRDRPLTTEERRQLRSLLSRIGHPDGVEP